jgi:hypothetical protein
MMSARIGVQHRHHDGHVGAADGDDERDAERERHQHDHPEREGALRAHEGDEQDEEQEAEADIDGVALRQHDRLAGHAPVELQEGDDRAREGDGADGGAKPHLEQARARDRARPADAEGLGRVERSRSDEDRREADQRVKEGHELGHGGHGDRAGPPGADGAADAQPQDQQEPAAEPARGRVEQGREDGQPHADHAEGVTLARGRGMGQAPQRQDEQHAGDEVEDGGKVG